MTAQDPDLFLCQITAYNPTLPGLVTIYVGSTGYMTGPADTPANTFFDGVLDQPGDLTRDMFDTGTTSGRSRMGFGDLVLNNADGALDYLVSYGLSSRFVIVRRGKPGAAYPAGFTTQYSGTMEQPEATGKTITIKLRDWASLLDQPLQATKYLGNNTLPNGLEGVEADLKGKPKPLCFGSLFNVPLTLVNGPKLIYQMSDGAVQSLNGVFDRGVRLGMPPSGFANGGATGFGANVIRFIASGKDANAAIYTLLVGDAGVVAYSANAGSSWTVDTGAGFGASNMFAAGFGIVQTSVGVFSDGWMIAGAAGKLSTFASPGHLGNPGSPTAQTSGFGATSIRAVRYLKELDRWIAVGDAGKIFTSDDGGATWTSRASGVATALYAIAWNGSAAVVVGAAGVILSSPTGVTWTARTSPFGASDITGVDAGNGVFIAVGQADKIATCPVSNGITWTLVSPVVGDSSAFRGICYDPQTLTFTAVGDDESIVSTQDGLVWTVQSHVGGSATEYLAIAKIEDGRWVLSTAGSAFFSQSPGTYANTTDLQDDTLAPAAGSYKTYLAGGYLRLGSIPAGLVTADVNQGAAAANRTAGQIFTAVLTKAGLAGTWNTGDITALDTANPAVIGYWTDQEVSIASVLDLVAASVWAGWWVDAGGVYRIQQFTAPSGSPVMDIVPNDMKRPLERVAARDVSRGLPTWRSIVRYGKNWAVQDTDLAAGVTASRRNFLAQEYREAKAENTAVQTVHSGAVQTVEDTLLYNAADAVTEAARRQTIRGVLRNRYAVVCQLNDDTQDLDLNMVVKLWSARFSLSAGVLHRVLGIAKNAKAREVTFTLWG